MLETALSGVDHGHIGFVAGLDGLVVVVRSAGLNHGGNTFADTHIHAVPERERMRR